MPINHPGQQRFPRLRRSPYGYWFKIIAAVPVLGLFVAGSVAAVMIRKGELEPIAILQQANL
jgi:hypothetical protein